MARELVKKRIDGLHYEFEQFGAKYSLKVLLRLSKIVGKPLGLAVGSLILAPGKKLLDKEVNPAVIGEAIEALTERMHEDEVMDLIEILTANNLLCDHKRVEFDTHYEGRLDHLFKVLWAALEVQYGNFIGVVTALQVKAPSQSQGTAPASQT